ARLAPARTEGLHALRGPAAPPQRTGSLGAAASRSTYLRPARQPTPFAGLRSALLDWLPRRPSRATRPPSARLSRPVRRGAPSTSATLRPRADRRGAARRRGKGLPPKYQGDRVRTRSCRPSQTRLRFGNILEHFWQRFTTFVVAGSSLFRVDPLSVFDWQKD